MTTFTATAANGITFAARILRPGDLYGRDGIHGPVAIEPGEEPQIEFFDLRYPHTPYATGEYGIEQRGQFTGGRYYLDTILEGPPSGLILDGGTPDWRIDADTMEEFRSWARAQQTLHEVRETFKAYLTETCEPVLMHDFDGRTWTIVWEEGPYDWTYLAAGGGVDEEMASLGEEFGMKPPSYEPIKVTGALIEPVSHISLGVYAA